MKKLVLLLIFLVSAPAFAQRTIHQFPDGSAAQAGDELPIQRGTTGTYSYKLNLGQIRTYVLTGNAATATALAANPADCGADTYATAIDAQGNLSCASISSASLAGSIALSKLATQSANTVVANVSGSTAVPTAAALPSCSTSGSALSYTSGTGFGCNTSIAAATATNATTASTATALASQSANTIVANATGSTAAPTAVAVPSCSGATNALGWTTSTGPTCNSSINAATLGGATFAAPGAIGGTTPAAGAFTTLRPTTSTGIPRVTAFPGSPQTNDTVVVTDDSAVGACDSAAGSSVTLCQWNGSAWVAIGDGSSVGGGGAPTGAKYWTGAADGTLSAEMNLGGLTTGLVVNTVSAGTGTPSAYSGTSCTNQFPRSLDASGTATCASVANADLAGSIALSKIATEAADTVVANVTGSTAAPTAASLPSCSSSGGALSYTSGTGFGCNTSIAASTAAALASDPTDCSADNYATGITANGNLTCGTVTNAGLAGSIALTKLATQAANTMVANATGSTAAPTAVAVPSCSGATNALGWTTSTGPTCNSSINAATLGGATFAAPGAIGGTTPAAGAFTTLRPTTSTGIPRVTAFPGSPQTNDTVVVTDDSAVGACDSAAGSSVTLCQWNGSAWVAIGDGTTGGGGGAPTGAKYWTGAADGTLSAEMNLGGLTTGLVLNTVSAGTGTPSAYTGASCTNQFPRSLDASGAPTCASVANADLAGSIALAKLATQAANTVVANATSGSATPTAISMTSCSTSASAVSWTTNTGFGCNTAVNAAQLNGATFAAPGAIGGTTPGTAAFTTITGSSVNVTSSTAPANGIYLPSANTFGISANSTQALTCTSTGCTVPGTLGITGNITAANLIPQGSVTSGGVFGYDGANVLTGAAVGAGLPVIGGGAGAAPGAGTRSGNTTAYVTTTGAQTSGDCVKIDASGNHVANGSACGGVTLANPTGTIGLTAVNGSAGTGMRSDGAPALSQAIVPTWTGVHTFSPAARSSGAAPFFIITTPADTSQTTTAEAIGFSKTAATRNWTTGGITLQREVVLGAPTYSFVGTSTIATAINLDVPNPIAGTNATLTKAYSIRGADVLFTGIVNAGSAPTALTNSTGKVLTAALAAPTGSGANVATSTGSLTSGNCVSIDANGNFVDNGAVCGGSGATLANPTGTIGLTAVNGVATSVPRSDSAPALSQAIAPTWTGVHAFAPTARSSGASPYFLITSPADTGQTTTAESIGVSKTASTRTWATGGVTLQREVVLAANTVAAAGSSTFATVINLDVANPIAGTNATITKGYSIRGGDVLFTGLISAGSTPTVLTDSAGKILSAALNTVGNSQGGAGGTFNSACATFVITPSSANLAACLSDKTGTGVNVFSVQPTITAPIITVQALSCNTATPTWTVSAGNVMTCTLNSTNITPSVTTSNLVGGSISIKIIQSATARTITWPNGNGTSTLKIKWPGGTAPTLSTASGAEDTVTCNVFSEFIWHCVWAGNFS